MKALVTGGAGYIGSHMVRVLLEAGHDVVVLDDLSTGYRDAVDSRARFVEGDSARTDDVHALLRDEKIEAVLHFAAKIRVEESVSNPRFYWQRNTVATLALLDAVVDAKLPFVFSSTAAVYGTPIRVPIDEDHPKDPVNPYGDTKLAVEKALAAFGAAHGLPWVALRYFNAAGAEPSAGLGERHDPETHLLPIVLEAALGTRKSLSINGTDWETPDGTCVRDYIHVMDLADAHLAALEHLRKNGAGASGAFNLGTGQGRSIREVIESAKRVTKREIPVVEGPRRAGDPAALVAKVDRAAKILGWKAKRSAIDAIVADAWAFKVRNEGKS